MAKILIWWRCRSFWLWNHINSITLRERERGRAIYIFCVHWCVKSDKCHEFILISCSGIFSFRCCTIVYLFCTFPFHIELMRSGFKFVKYHYFDSVHFFFFGFVGIVVVEHLRRASLSKRGILFLDDMFKANFLAFLARNFSNLTRNWKYQFYGFFLVKINKIHTLKHWIIWYVCIKQTNSCFVKLAQIQICIRI